MGSTWGRQDPGEPHVGPMILDVCALSLILLKYKNTKNEIGLMQKIYNSIVDTQDLQIYQ